MSGVNSPSPVAQHRVLLDRRFLTLALGAIAAFAVFWIFPAVQVGDGSEYYALYVAWKETARPWMTADAWDYYNHLVATGSIEFLDQNLNLDEHYTQLHVHGSVDFVHFWFYSFLAAVIGTVLRFLGLDVVHTGFLVLHAALLFLTTAIAQREFGWRGVAAVIALTFFSPVLWYFNKVHTEFFTFCLALCAVMLALRARYIGAALCLAAASTQNPSFAIVAGFLFGVRFLWCFRRPFSAYEVAGALTTVLLVLLAPAYYLTRYGIVSPFFITESAQTFPDFSVAHIWLFDPDIGLLPNWPLGLTILLAGVAIWIGRHNRTGKTSTAFLGANPIFLGFVIVYLATSLYANCSTANIHHGAAPICSRYGIWYIPLFFPVFFNVVTYIETSTRKPFWFALSAAAAAVLAIFNVWDSWPARADDSSPPRPLSYLIQSKLPWLYNPPAKIFFARYAGNWPKRAKAIIGPDCRKILLVPGKAFDNVSNAVQCGLDPVGLGASLDARRASLRSPAYFYLTDDEAQRLPVRLEPGRVYQLGTASQGTDHDGGIALGDGWSGREGWGVWSDGRVAHLFLPCPAGKAHFDVSLRLAAYTEGEHNGTAVAIKAAGVPLWSGDIGEVPLKIALSIPRNVCVRDAAKLEVDIASPRSPKKLGVSSDARELGVAFTQFVYSQ